MSSFRKCKVLLVESVGRYTDGVWIPGSRRVSSVLASVQPVTASSLANDLMPMPEGRHLSDYIKIYTDSRLNITADGEGIQPDIIVHEGYGYEITTIFINHSDVISHYRYNAVKVFKFTNSVDWVNGTLKRL